MTDPERWLNSGDAPQGMEQMLQAAKTNVPTQAQKLALAGKIGVAGSGAWVLPAAVKALAIGAVVTGGAWGIATSMDNSEPGARQSEPSVAAATSAPDEASEQQEPVLGKTPEPSPESETGTAETAERSGPASAAIPSEASLIRQAKAALETSPHWALSLLAKHEAHYESGLLAEEREVLRLRALKKLGRDKAAAAQEEKFRQEHPDSVHHVP